MYETVTHLPEEEDMPSLVFDGYSIGFYTNMTGKEINSLERKIGCF